MDKKKAPIERRVLNHIHEHCLLEGVQRLLVAVSGGPDSVCLLHILDRLRGELGLGLHVAHLDHQLRGADSAADAAYVEQLATQLGIPVTSQARDVKSHRARHRLSIEEAAREVRYAFLAEVARSTDSQAVAVGHTRDDNIETILMHIVRGTGTRGLRGLLPVTNLTTSSGRAKVVRPLLGLTREETAAYCFEHGLAPRADETNLSLSMFRNRIRIELLPLLRRYNPQIDAALSRAGKISGDEFSFLNENAAEVWADTASREGDIVVLKKKGLVGLHPALKRHILRLAIRELIPDLKDIETLHIEGLLDAIGKPAGKVFQLPGGLVFVVEHARYVLGRDTVSLCPFPPLREKFALNVPGETIAPGWKVIARVFPRDGVELDASSNHGEDGEFHYPRASVTPEFATTTGLCIPDTLTASFDYARIGDRLAVRTVQPGDRFEPLGLGASKKVGEFMIDARVPRSWRRRVPIVIASDQVAWVVGWRIDERVRVTADTVDVLSLEFIRLP